MPDEKVASVQRDMTNVHRFLTMVDGTPENLEHAAEALQVCAGWLLNLARERRPPSLPPPAIDGFNAAVLVVSPTDR